MGFSVTVGSGDINELFSSNPDQNEILFLALDELRQYEEEQTGHL